MKLLIVDDSSIMRRTIEKHLVNYDLDIVGTAKNGKEAIQMFQDKQPDVVTMDITMPEMDGIELARRAGTLAPSMRVMFITGFAAVALNRNAKSISGAKVLSKPFHLRELVQEIDKVLAA